MPSPPAPRTGLAGYADPGGPAALDPPGLPGASTETALVTALSVLGERSPVERDAGRKDHSLLGGPISGGKLGLGPGAGTYGAHGTTGNALTTGPSA